MRTVLQGWPDQPFTRPDGLTRQAVCTLSGLLPTPNCPHTGEEWFIAGTEPTQPDNIYKQVWVDAATGGLANDSTPASRRQPLIVLDLPVSVIPWAHTQGLPLLADLQPSAPTQGEAASVSQAPALLMVSPAADATYRLAADFDPAAQQLPIQVTANQPFASISILVDGKIFIRFTAPPYETWWPLTPGEHSFSLGGVTVDGQTLTTQPVHITVLNP